MDDELLSQSRVLKGPYEVSFDITNHCNYRCLHCYNASGENNVVCNELSDEEIYRMLKDLLTLEPNNVCFCGGEPLTRFDTLIKSIDILSEGGTPSISMVSNGYFASFEKLSQLKEHGLKRIQISLDGSNSETCFKLRQNREAYDKAVSALKNSRDVGFKDINVAFCPTRFNIPELEQVINTCIDLNVSYIRVQPLMAIGRATHNLKEIMPTRDQYITMIQESKDFQDKYSSEIGIEWGDPLDHIFRYKDRMKNQNIFLSIRADGTICPSPYLPITVGNVRKHKLSEYWEFGLCRAWSMPQVKEMADKIMCIGDMSGGTNGMPETWFDENIDIDIIDNNVFGKW